MKKKTDILLLFFYREPFGPTVMDHITCIEKYSDFNVLPLNLAEPNAVEIMRSIDCSCIVMHYTLFGMQYYLISEEQAWFVGESSALKVAFFQDEFYRFPKRCHFIDEYGVQVVYSLLEPQHYRETYYSRSKVSVVMHTLAGYVSDSLLEASSIRKPLDAGRDIDVAYRGHELDISYGLAGQEKRQIGEEFTQRQRGSGLRCDIETAVGKRIYGSEWFEFIGRARAMLGVEAGVSAFDLDDVIRKKVRLLRRANPEIDARTLWEEAVAPYEDNIYYRTISPRHFEAAAFETAQILFEGRYTGILEPWKHYVPLRKDFSNFEEVLSVLRDNAALQEIAACARREIIDSGRFHYKEFVFDFDRQLRMMGLRPRTLERAG